MCVGGTLSWTLPSGAQWDPHSEKPGKILYWLWNRKRKHNHFEICQDCSPKQKELCRRKGFTRALGRRAFIQFYSLPHPKSFLYYLRGEIKAKKHCCKSQLRDMGPLNDWDLIINWKKLLPYLATIPRGIGVTVAYSEKSCITKTLSKWE